MMVRLSVLTPGKIPGTDFYYRLSQLPGHSVAGNIPMTTEKSNNLEGNQIHDLPACSTVPQTTMLLHALKVKCKGKGKVVPVFN
jgi:hypothetical protein